MSMSRNNNYADECTAVLLSQLATVPSVMLSPMLGTTMVITSPCDEKLRYHVGRAIGLSRVNEKGAPSECGRERERESERTGEIEKQCSGKQKMNDTRPFLNMKRTSR